MSEREVCADLLKTLAEELLSREAAVEVGSDLEKVKLLKRVALVLGPSFIPPTIVEELYRNVFLREYAVVSAST